MSNTTGAEIRRIRNTAKLTQAELAQRIGMTVTSISRIETGAQVLTRPTEIAIRSVCGAPPMLDPTVNAAIRRAVRRALAGGETVR